MIPNFGWDLAPGVTTLPGETRTRFPSQEAAEAARPDRTATPKPDCAVCFEQADMVVGCVCEDDAVAMVGAA